MSAIGVNRKIVIQYQVLVLPVGLFDGPASEPLQESKFVEYCTVPGTGGLVKHVLHVNETLKSTCKFKRNSHINFSDRYYSEQMEISC